MDINLNTWSRSSLTFDYVLQVNQLKAELRERKEKCLLLEDSYLTNVRYLMVWSKINTITV